MKFTDTLLGLLRRWYILVPGLLLTAMITLIAWSAVSPGYSRSATQLLLPGANSVPEGGNPYLFLGGLAPAADVLVRAVGSENVLNEVVKKHPGVEIEISRDTTTSGPIVLIAVTASSDDAAEDALSILIDRTATVLNEFQETEAIPESNRMTVIPVTIDEKSTQESRSRLLAASGAAILGTVITLLAASLAGGSRRPRREPETVAPVHRNNTSHAAPRKREVDALIGSAPNREYAPGPPDRPPAGGSEDEHPRAARRQQVKR